MGLFRLTFSRLSVAGSVARPASYARENVKLAYATKVRRAQGPTVNMAEACASERERTSRRRLLLARLAGQSCSSRDARRSLD